MEAYAPYVFKPYVLFRADEQNESELAVAERHMPVVRSRVMSRFDRDSELVVGRYSVLPFYEELHDDLADQGYRLVNSVKQHKFVADFGGWYSALNAQKGPALTPFTWFDTASLPKRGGPFVVKGLTNSRKFEWDSMMFAPTYEDALRITRLLGQDGLIGSQGVVYRKYVPLRTLEVGLNGLPFANEWRFFYWGRRRLCHGFYWTATEKRATITPEGMAVAQAAADRLAPHVNFFVVDVAETAGGRWIVIEVNDGQMSGLSECSADELYSSLATCSSYGLAP